MMVMNFILVLLLARRKEGVCQRLVDGGTISRISREQAGEQVARRDSMEVRRRAALAHLGIHRSYGRLNLLAAPLAESCEFERVLRVVLRIGLSMREGNQRLRRNTRSRQRDSH